MGCIGARALQIYQDSMNSRLKGPCNRPAPLLRIPSLSARDVENRGAGISANIFQAELHHSTQHLSS